MRPPPEGRVTLSQARPGIDPVEALVQDLRAVLASAADPERAPRMQAYMKSEMPFRGVSAVPLRRICREVLTAHRLGDRPSWERAVRRLWDGAAYREERYAAVALTGHPYYRDHQDADTLGLYRHLVVSGAWWDFVDDIAVHRVGPILAADPATVAPLVRSWAREEDMWVRRTAVLCQLARKSETDPVLLADVIEANLAGSTFGDEFFVRKAIGWALREYTKTAPAWVCSFVEQHADEMSSLSQREALRNLGPSV